eukprot:scaffold10129_cov69-Cyclotella_meneghiniana.AAC.2
MTHFQRRAVNVAMVLTMENGQKTAIVIRYCSQRLHNFVALGMAALLMVLGIRQLSYLAAFDSADVIVMANFACQSLAREEEGLSLASKHYTSYL